MMSTPGAVSGKLAMLGLAAFQPIRCQRAAVARPCGGPLRLRGLVVDRDRFWELIEPADGDECRLWLGRITNHGYGFWCVDGVVFSTHRLAYELAIGPIPTGLTIDHLCRNRACCNPHHLEPVTNRENVMRGAGFGAINARKTHCSRGHEYTPENTYRRPDGPGWRKCRTCELAREAERTRVRRARARAECKN